MRLPLVRTLQYYGSRYEIDFQPMPAQEVGAYQDSNFIREARKPPHDLSIEREFDNVLVLFDRYSTGRNRPPATEVTGVYHWAKNKGELQITVETVSIVA